MPLYKFVKSNLFKNTQSGRYYARVKVKGKTIWKSLDTDARSVADTLLTKTLAEMRTGNGAKMGPGVTLAECAATYLQNKSERGYRRRNRQGIEQSSFKPLKARSLDYRKETVAALKKLWDGFDTQNAALVTETRCHAVADAARRKYGPTRFNGIVQSMRGILAVAVECGALKANPAMGVYFAEVKPSNKAIPTREQMSEVLRMLDAHPRRKFSRLSVRFMAFTGLRPNEARHLEASDINLSASTITARATKNGQPRTIQMISQAADLLKEEGVTEILKALKKNPRRTLMTIGGKLGINLTPYTMRHLHMTALVESGIDLPTAALISGHQDRGVTLLRHYLHARPEHVRKQLSKVVI